MKLSTRLITAGVAMALLAVGVIGIGSQGTASAEHEDDKVFLTNEWSGLTTDPDSDDFVEDVTGDSTLYTTFEDLVDDEPVNTIKPGADELRITVVDEDASEGVTQTDTFTVDSFGEITIPAGGDDPTGGPIFDRNGDGVVDSDDVTVISDNDPDGDASIRDVEAGSTTRDAFVTIRGVDPDTEVELEWETPTLASVDVDVTTPQASGDDGLEGLELEETSRGSGQFERVIRLVDRDALEDEGSDADADPAEIGILDTFAVSVVYTSEHDGDEEEIGPAEATADTGAPEVTVSSPDHESATQNDRPDFTGTASDGTSGLHLDSIMVRWEDELGDPSDFTSPFDNSDDDIDLGSGADDGDSETTLDFQPSSDEDLDEGWTVWQFEVADIAGNVGTSDSDVDEENEAGIGQPHAVNIDLTEPSMGDAQAFSGVTLGEDDDGELELQVGNRRAIAVEFDEPLDPDSVQATDFEITTRVSGSETGGITPESAEVGSGDFADHVFLMLEMEQDSDADPGVRLVNPVEDPAGNEANTPADIPGNQTYDALPPQLTITLDDGTSDNDPSGLTNGPMTITIESDETLSGNPTVDIFSEHDGEREGSVSAVSTGSNTWEAQFDGSQSQWNGGDEDNVGGFDKSVVVTASDASISVPGLPDAGVATEGSEDIEDAPYVFTLDKVITEELNMTAPGAETADSEPIVRLDFDEEVTATAAEFGPEGDLEDVTDDLVQNRRQILYPAVAPEQGEYEIRVEIMDNAGNESDVLSATFERVPRSPFSMELLPGSNFVSFPRQLADGDINEVFDDEAITSVTTFDPDNGDNPLVSQRDDGELVGDVDTVEMGRGYIVVTNAVVELEVDLVDVDPGSGPPTANLSEGWSLTGIIDIGGDPETGLVTEFGNTVSSRADYYPSEVTQVYTWDVVTKRWMSVESADPVNSGGAYWTYATEDTVIVP